MNRSSNTTEPSQLIYVSTSAKPKLRSYHTLTIPTHPSDLFRDHVLKLAKDSHLISPTQDLSEIQWVECKEGLTNQLFLVITSTTKFLVRLYGQHTDRFIDRQEEMANFHFLASHGLAPPLYASFANGLLYGYIPGSACTPNDFPPLSQAIATHLRSWHQLPIPPHSESKLFPTMEKWLNLLKPSVPLALFNQLSSALTELQRRLPQSRLVFSHNDLLSGNILKLKDGSVRFIDYEYGGIGYAAFDIANHFCEWAGFECDWSKFPTPEQQRQFLRTYLATSHVESMYQEVQKYFLASHLFWCLWGYLQSITEKTIDFDYAAYAQRRWKGYVQWEHKLEEIDEKTAVNFSAE